MERIEKRVRAGSYELELIRERDEVELGIMPDDTWEEGAYVVMTTAQAQELRSALNAILGPVAVTHHPGEH